MPEADSHNPFVGPRPFDRAERDLFFGRPAEVRELLSLIVSSRVLLFYSASGAGKTSLLNAGVIPLLEEQEGFEVLPPARLQATVADKHRAGARNVYTTAVLSNWTSEGGAAAAGAETLASHLAARPHARDDDGFEMPRALVFDQFEELFTVAQEHWKHREPFVREIADALEADPLLRVVIAMREDYIAQLEPFADLLPGALRTRSRLERLDRDAALLAVTGPLERTDRRFAPKVAEALVDDLLTFHVDTGTGEPEKVEGEFAEPVQLQVACHSLWGQLPPDVKEITAEHLLRFGDVDEVLGRYYDEAVHAAAASSRTREGRLRRGLEETLITKVGTRGTAIRETATTGELPNAAVDELESRHVVRAERRAGARWYELTHDRLIEPIQASNRRYRDAGRRKRLQWQAALVGTVILAAVATVGIIRAQVEGDVDAAEAQAEAERTRAAAADERANELSRVVGADRARVLSAHQDIVVSVDFDPSGSLFVSSSWDGTARIWALDRRLSVSVLHASPGPVHWAAFSRDGRLVGTASDDGSAQIWDVATRRLTARLRGHTKRVATIAFAPDGRRVVTSSDDGTARIWNLRQRLTLHVLDAPREMYSANFDPQGRRVVTGGMDGIVRIWDANTGTRLQTLSGHRAPVQATAFDPSGTRIGSASDDGTARIWWLDTRSPLVLEGHRGFVYGIAFDPSGTRVVTASADGTARVWRLDTEKQLAVLRGHSGEVIAAAFSPDGSAVLTAGADSTVRLWDWRDKRHRATTPGQATVRG